MIHYYYYKMYIEKSAHGLKATRDSWTEYLGSGEGHGFTADVFMYKRNIVTVIIDGVAINNADPFREFYHRNEFITSFPLGGLALVIGGGTGFYAGKLPGLFIGGGLGLGTGVFGSSILHGANYERMDSYDVAFQWIIALEYVHRSGAKSEVNKVKDEFRLLKRFRTDYPKKYRFKPDIKIE